LRFGLTGGFVWGREWRPGQMETLHWVKG